MGDMGDYWRDFKPILKADSSARKKRNAEGARQLLSENNISYTEHNIGLHLIVSHGDKVVDFYPTTGKFMVRGGKSGRGVFNLLKILKCEV